MRELNRLRKIALALPEVNERLLSHGAPCFFVRDKQPAAAILQIAAGLAAGLPVRLRDAVTGLDHANLTAVTDAIMTVGGHHRR